MNFAFSEEQEELRKTVRSFLEQKSPSAEVRRLMETTEGYDPDVWGQMGSQLGLQGLAVPEEYGGSGYGYIELHRRARGDGPCAPVRALLRHGRPRRQRLVHSGDDTAKKELLPGIAAGDTIATARLYRGQRALGRRPASP